MWEDQFGEGRLVRRRGLMGWSLDDGDEEGGGDGSALGWIGGYLVRCLLMVWRSGGLVARFRVVVRLWQVVGAPERDGRRTVLWNQVQVWLVRWSRPEQRRSKSSVEDGPTWASSSGEEEEAKQSVAMTMIPFLQLPRLLSKVRLALPLPIAGQEGSKSGTRHWEWRRGAVFSVAQRRLG